MEFLFRNNKVLILLAVLLALFLMFSGGKITEKTFVGKWRSSKLGTPIYLYQNGEWEIKKDDGVVLQYGVWQYKDKNLIWSYKVDGSVGYDPNPLISANSEEFKLQEADGTTTTFSRLE